AKNASAFAPSLARRSTRRSFQNTAQAARTNALMGRRLPSCARLGGGEVEALERLLGEARARRLRRDPPAREDRHAVGDREGAAEAVGHHDPGAAPRLEGVEVVLEALGAV